MTLDEKYSRVLDALMEGPKRSDSLTEECGFENRIMCGSVLAVLVKQGAIIRIGHHSEHYSQFSIYEITDVGVAALNGKIALTYHVRME